MSFIDSVVNFIFDQLVVIDAVEEQDLTVYKYGAKALLNTVISFICVLLFAVTLKTSILASLFFSITFLLMRTYIGGFHLQNATLCFWLSRIMEFIAIYTLTYSSYFKISTLLLSGFVCMVIIFLVAPVETRNKTLDALEIQVYGKRAKVVTFLAYLILAILLWLDLKQLSFAVLIAILVSTITAIIGLIVNRIEKSKLR